MSSETIQSSDSIAALPPDKTSLSSILRSLGQVDRPKLETFIEAAIEAIDELDGDPDLEDDDPSGGNVEDEGEPEYPEGRDRYHGEDQTVIFCHRGDPFAIPGQSIDRWQR